MRKKVSACLGKSTNKPKLFYSKMISFFNIGLAYFLCIIYMYISVHVKY